jgi:hypothetical protein
MIVIALSYALICLFHLFGDCLAIVWRLFGDCLAIVWRPAEVLKALHITQLLDSNCGA